MRKRQSSENMMYLTRMMQKKSTLNIRTINRFEISPSGVESQGVNQDKENGWENPVVGYNLWGQCARSYHHHYNTEDYEVEEKEGSDGVIMTQEGNGNTTNVNEKRVKHCLGRTVRPL